MLKVWELDGLKLLSERYVFLKEILVIYEMNTCIRELPKKPTSMLFTADGQTILVSDKFGDVFRQVRSSHLYYPDSF